MKILANVMSKPLSIIIRSCASKEDLSKHLSEIYKGFENKNKNIICKIFFFPPLPLQLQFDNKNISYFSFYQSQHDGVFHNQVLRCASRTPCPQGLSTERGEYQVLQTLSCYSHHTVMAFCPILPYIRPPPTHKTTGWHLKSCMFCSFVHLQHISKSLVL